MCLPEVNTQCVQKNFIKPLNNFNLRQEEMKQLWCNTKPFFYPIPIMPKVVPNDPGAAIFFLNGYSSETI
jgi:hypothetical protein